MTADMPLRPTTVRFAEDAMDLVQAAAGEAGCSVAQFIREAAVMRAASLMPDQIPHGPDSPETEHLSRGHDT